MHTASKVSEAIAEAAFCAVAVHPMHAEATAWPYCVSDVFAQPKSFIDRMRIADAQKSALHNALEGVSTVLLVSYWTSDKKPEPMSGFGKIYGFVLHPETLAVLQTDVGTWRS